MSTRTREQACSLDARSRDVDERSVVPMFLLVNRREARGGRPHTCQKLRPNVVMTRSTSADMAAIVALLVSQPTGPRLQEPGAHNALSRTREAGMPVTEEKASSRSRSDCVGVVSTRPDLSHAEARALHGLIGFDYDGFDHSEQPYH